MELLDAELAPLGLYWRCGSVVLTDGVQMGRLASPLTCCIVDPIGLWSLYCSKFILGIWACAG